MHTRERAGDALLWAMLIKSIRTVATLIDVNFHVITKNTCRLQILTNIPDVSKKARRLIQCKLTTTVLTRSALIFSESSYFILKFVKNRLKVRQAMVTESQNFRTG